MEHSRFLLGLVLAALLPQVSFLKIVVEEHEDQVILSCDGNFIETAATQGILSPDKTKLNLGKRIQDPRGIYECNGTKGQSFTQVHYRMCQKCVELDSATLAGIIVTDIIATLLLALGVYCFAGHETGKLSGVADSQALLRNDQLYQPLREREDAQYSHLGGNWPRNK
ncbi:PREDICTED: T-cell surface glycoprotein CD3 delta chain [Elephantulus edwardii]|uniref:T-cell surface glycoprotein CD3 delta chain n=1 Tax=Elephantulus edwardii TaxID=28737 RepID=UPI0003F0D08B|nr:PREDICTED: T-cell surface glycoprotein CD3 delta chain [Elephantulus edwardii]